MCLNVSTSAQPVLTHDAVTQECGSLLPGSFTQKHLSGLKHSFTFTPPPKTAGELYPKAPWKFYPKATLFWFVGLRYPLIWKKWDFKKWKKIWRSSGKKRNYDDCWNIVTS